MHHFVTSCVKISLTKCNFRVLFARELYFELPFDLSSLFFYFHAHLPSFNLTVTTNQLSLAMHSGQHVHKNVHMTVVTPENQHAVMGANIDAVEYNNQAIKEARAGNHQGAFDLNLKALKLKIRAFGEESVQAALTYNAIGENYSSLHKWKEAEEALRKSLRVRDELAIGPRFDAAVTRDNMARVYEATGRWSEAKEIRLKGAKEDNIACGNYQVKLRRRRCVLKHL